MKRRRASQGTSMVELLVVIVVFTVGILAVIQIFPPGLSILRSTARTTVATELARGEMERLKAAPEQVPGMITVPPPYLLPSVRWDIYGQRLPDDFTPPPGQIRANGDYDAGTGALGHWAYFSGPNLFRAVIGESRPVPAPRPVGTLHGGLMNLTFAPIFFDPARPDASLKVIGNDLKLYRGDRTMDVPSLGDNPNQAEAFFVGGRDTLAGGEFAGRDQLWLGPSTRRAIWLSFTYDRAEGGTLRQRDYENGLTLNPSAIPPYARIAGGWWVVSLPDLIGAEYRGVQLDTLRLRRQYERIGVGVAFDPNNPFQYRLINGPLGSILFNPVAASARVEDSAGDREPLTATVDYLVHDWRVLREDFRVPMLPALGGGTESARGYRHKLALGSLKVMGQPSADNRTNPGLGLQIPAPATGNPGATDFAIMDLQTGGVILGNAPSGEGNSYTVDKSRGVIVFRDVDEVWNAEIGNGLSAWISLPTGSTTAPWSSPVLLPEVRGRSLRALYMAREELAVVAFKAAAQYRQAPITTVFSRAGVFALADPVSGFGQADRLYFRSTDLGQRVSIGEVWYRVGGQLNVVRDQEYKIDGTELVAGDLVSFVDLGSKLPLGATLDFTNGYAVRGVRGVSMRVRAMWNPETVRLGDDGAANHRAVRSWSQNWRRLETEGFVLGSLNGQ